LGRGTGSGYWERSKVAGKIQHRIRLKHGSASDLVAKGSKILIPDFRKAGYQILRVSARNGAACVDQVSPSVNAAPAVGETFERDPLGQGRTHRVVNPPDALAGNTARNDMLNASRQGTKNLYFEATAGLPWATFGPVNRAVNVSEGVPTTTVGKGVPAKARVSLGEDRILKSKHKTS
jgi:hypothetical protein